MPFASDRKGGVSWRGQRAREDRGVEAATYTLDTREGDRGQAQLPVEASVEEGGEIYWAYESADSRMRCS